MPIHRAKGNIDLTFLVLVLALLVCGLVLMFSASYAYAYYYEGNSFHYITRQLVWAGLGLAAMTFLSTWDYHIWHRFAWLAFGVTVIMLIIVYFMPDRNGAHRWIFLLGQQFQPTEVAKFSIVLLFSHMISLNYDKMGTFQYGILPYGIILVIYAGLIVFEPHLSATILIMALGVILIFVGGPASSGSAWGWRAASPWWASPCSSPPSMSVPCTASTSGRTPLSIPRWRGSRPSSPSTPSAPGG